MKIQRRKFEKGTSYTEDHRSYYLAHRLEILEKQKKYAMKNRAKISKKEKDRLNNDPLFRMRKNLRRRLTAAIKNCQKKGSAITDLGCSVQYLRVHLESLFSEGMNWSNYGFGPGKWNIDHIKPLTRFDLSDPDEIKIACNYKNLQPLWMLDNKTKGNKYGR